MIVNRDYETADALRAALEGGFDYEVQVATGVFEAGLLARQARPHVMLLDTAVPGLKAREMRLALRSDPELVATRVVAVEEELTEDLTEQRMSEGFDSCLAKPYKLSSVVRTIEEATNIVA